MADPILQTKLHVPRRRRGLVTRPRLSERLDAALESTLTLVSAPPGFGKTTLLAEWLTDTAVDGRSGAWLSLDQRDNDPALYWTYLLTALQTAAPRAAAAAQTFLQTPPAPIEAVLANVINELSAEPNDLVLVLDDYHLIEALEVHEGMAFLLEHLPPQVHVVIAGRADPALPVARLRGRGDLVEIRAAELRFTPEEAASYLNGAMGLALTAADVAALEARTEGWITALQLAALSMQGRADIPGFIASFAGDDRYIVDYLVEEVLQRQPEQVQDFLLQTSILSRLDGSLCDAVTGQGGGRAMLQVLDRGNLFLVPLDDRRRWYRYHHLFADVLHARLLDERPDHAQDLHRRASAWHQQNGDSFEAIRHALAGQDFERAASLLELEMPALRRDRQEDTLRRWLAALPDEQIRVRPVLCNGLAGAILVKGEVEGVETHLRAAERWLDPSGTLQPSASEVMVVSDQAAFRRLPGSIAVHRAGLCRVLGDVPGTITHARRALDVVDPDDDVGRGAAAALLGLAHWTNGDLDAAYRSYADGMASLEKAGFVTDVVGGSVTLADLRIAQGRLGEAMSIYERALRKGAAPGGPVLRGSADMHVGISVLLRERNELDAAAQHLLMSRELGEHLGFPQNPYRWRVAMARIREAEGDLDSALALLEEAERRYVNDFAPDVRPVPALKARVWINQERVDEAFDWARQAGLSVDDDLSYVREFEHVTLARALLARHRADRAERDLDEATDLLGRLLHAAEDGGRMGSTIEILVLQALARQARGEVSLALQSLGRALAMAEPEGYVRTFLDEGAPLAALLRAMPTDGAARGSVRRLLADLGSTEDSRESAPARHRLVEPLSKRELDVLRLLGTDLDGPDIARALVVSLNTVRTHTKNIYAKLGVNSRRAAVRRAKDLDLMSRTGDR